LLKEGDSHMHNKRATAEWESPRQCAEALGISRGTIYGLIAQGKLDARKLAGRTIISVESRRALTDSLPKAEVAPQRKPTTRSQPAA
jgi:excisionase family DNA binding protein